MNTKSNKKPDLCDKCKFKRCQSDKVTVVGCKDFIKKDENK